MKLYCFVTIFSFLTIKLVRSLPTGPTPATCQAMLPRGFPGFGHYNAVFKDYGFKIIPSSLAFSPGSDVTVTLSGIKDYRGIFLQVRDGDDLATSRGVGSWLRSVVPDVFRIVDCSLVNFDPNSAISHSSAADKSPSHDFIWTAPECKNGQELYIKAVIVKNLTAVQDLITVPIRCLRSDSTAPQQGSCVYQSLNNIPSDYNNGFESFDIFRGWDAESTGGYMWRLGKGKTASKGTGPNGAFEGRRYLYTEASYPSKPGDVAVLETRRDLRGCFCLSVAYNFNVKGRGHVLVFEIGGEEKLRITGSRFQTWTPLLFRVDTPDFIKVRILATRGMTYRGDMALDNIEFIPGPC